MASAAAVSEPGYRLTKTKYCLGVQCAKALYLLTHQPGLAVPPDAGLQLLFDQGTEVGIEAQRRCPGGTVIGERDDFQTAVESTRAAVAARTPYIFEAAFLYGEVYVRVDILRHVENGVWDLIEVKSSTRADDHHRDDLAVQVWVARQCGLKIQHAFLRHLNTECHYPDLSNLFADADLTAAVDAEMPAVEKRVREQTALLDGPAAPAVAIGLQCDSPYSCRFKEHCWKEVPEHSVFELNRLKRSIKFDLYGQGVRRIQDLPTDLALTPLQKNQHQAVTTSGPVIDRAGLAAFLARFQYPIAYLDFETINPAVPRFAGTRPYQHTPFQFSVHEVSSPGERPLHHEYLHQDSGDPRVPLAEALLSAIGPRGSVIAYHVPFERAVLESLAQHLPQHRDRLHDMATRLIDLQDAFLLHYFHPDFHGSTSIKKTLPVLVPSLSYSGLPIQNGALAQAGFYRLLAPSTPAEDRQRLKEELLEYCGQDSLAMVLIHQALHQLLE